MSPRPIIVVEMERHDLQSPGNGELRRALLVHTVVAANPCQGPWAVLNTIRMFDVAEVREVAGRRACIVDHDERSSLSPAPDLFVSQPIHGKPDSPLPESAIRRDAKQPNASAIAADGDVAIGVVVAVLDAPDSVE